MKKLAIATAAFLALETGMVAAQDESFYAGGKLGGYDVDQGLVDLNDFALGGYFGYRFNEYVSAEVEYVHLFEDTTFGVDIDADFWALSVRPTLPLNEDWELYAKLGWGYLDAEASGGSTSVSDSDDDFVWGLGAQWQGSQIHVRGEVQADSDVPDFLIYTIGIGFSF